MLLLVFPRSAVGSWPRQMILATGVPRNRQKSLTEKCLPLFGAESSF
jgi:hypothetical protein